MVREVIIGIKHQTESKTSFKKQLSMKIKPSFEVDIM